MIDHIPTCSRWGGRQRTVRHLLMIDPLDLGEAQLDHLGWKETIRSACSSVGFDSHIGKDDFRKIIGRAPGF